MKRRGTNLVFVLGLFSVAVFMVFTVADMSVFHLQFSKGIDRRENAHNLAEGAINLAIAKIVEQTWQARLPMGFPEMQPTTSPSRPRRSPTLRCGTAISRSTMI